MMGACCRRMFLTFFLLFVVLEIGEGQQKFPGEVATTGFRPFNIDGETKTQTKVTIVTADQVERFKQCPSSLLQLETDVSFYIQRDDSSSKSSITYWRFDTGQLETFTFDTGYTDHTHVTYDGENLKCWVDPRWKVSCNNLPIDRSVRAVVVSVNFDPRNGKAYKDQWFRNKYTLHGSYFHVKCQPVVRPWLLQQTNVCFGARDNKFGTFHLQQDGKLIALKLVHKSGYVACGPGEQYKSHWGCVHPDVDLGVYITDQRNRQIFPRYVTYPTAVEWYKRAWYFIPGYHAMSPTLVFTDVSAPMYGVRGAEVRVWYGEDLINYSEENDSGTSCADVYAQFA